MPGGHVSRSLQGIPSGYAGEKQPVNNKKKHHRYRICGTSLACAGIAASAARGLSRPFQGRQIVSQIARNRIGMEPGFPDSQGDH
jgi:hypothetical protein